MFLGDAARNQWMNGAMKGMKGKMRKWLPIGTISIVRAGTFA